MTHVPSNGQASSEYVAILLVVAVVLAGAATAAATVTGVGERVIAGVRTGICIVGGDICRDGDAEAVGLAPCLTSERSKRQDTTLDVAVLRLGGHGEWQLALQSDGRAVVTRLEENELGGTVGVGLTFSPARIRADATAALVAGYHGGSAWRFADARSAAAFLDAASRAGSVREGRAPDVRWHALGGRADAAAGVAVAELTRAGLTVAAAGAIGLRDDGDRRTLTLDMGIDELDLAADVPGFPAGPGDEHAWVADVTWERGELREFALRTATRTSERVEEYSAVLDLREPGNRAAAARLLRPGSSTPVDLAALAARIGSHGVVQRDGYSVTERRRGFGIAGKLGVALGLEHQRITSERRLVDAVAWVRGGPPQRRFDCLGV